MIIWVGRYFYILFYLLSEYIYGIINFLLIRVTAVNKFKFERTNCKTVHFGALLVLFLSDNLMSCQVRGQQHSFLRQIAEGQSMCQKEEHRKILFFTKLTPPSFSFYYFSEFSFLCDTFLTILFFSSLYMKLPRCQFSPTPWLLKPSLFGQSELMVIWRQWVIHERASYNSFL